MSEEVLIVGAGAIGRGFLPWMFARDYDLVFVDSNAALVEAMQSRGAYDTFMVRDGRLDRLRVPVRGAYLPSAYRVAEHPRLAAAFVAVGPRDCVGAVQAIGPLKCPLVVCENDRNPVTALSYMAAGAYFAVPDVITSATAPTACLNADALAVVSEAGELFIDGRVGALRGEFTPCSAPELDLQWTAKLYLHNTPHCIAAYMGAISNVTYLHEAMAVPFIAETVGAAMDEMTRALIRSSDISETFLNAYARKELDRFTCTLLHDPISRVAREPLRKLEPRGRLLGAAQLCLSVGVIPVSILKGIAAATLFEHGTVEGSVLSLFRRSLYDLELKHSVLLTQILGLRDGEALALLLNAQLEALCEELLSELRPRADGGAGPQSHTI